MAIERERTAKALIVLEQRKLIGHRAEHRRSSKAMILTRTREFWITAIVPAFG